MFESSSYHFNFQAIPLLIVGLIMLAGGVFVFTRNVRSRVNLYFLLICISVTLWLLSTAMGYLSGDTRVAATWFKIDNFGVIFISINVYSFVARFLGLEKEKRISIALGYALALGFGLTALTTDLLVAEVRRYFWGYFPVWGALSVPVLILFFGYMLAALQSLYVNYRRTVNPARRNQIKYFFLAFLFAYTASVDYLPVFGVEVYPFGFLSIAFFLTIIAYAIVRYRLMDIKAAVTRAGVFLLVYTLVLGLPFWLGFKTGAWFRSMVLMGVLASVGPFMFYTLRNKAESILLAQQRRYQKILLQSSGGMVREHNLGRLLKLIVYVIKRAVGIKFAAVFLNNSDEETYELKAIRNGAGACPPCSFAHRHPLITYMQKHREPFTFEELPQDVKESVDIGLPVSLIVPSFIEDRLMGFLMLGNKLNRTLYSRDDTNIFMTLSNQAALAIENCIFMEEFKKNQERMFHSEKLAAIGGMADGVAHQIKNRLNQFSVAAGEQKFEIEDFIRDHPALMAENPGLRKTFDYLTYISDSLNDNVKKTAGVIQGILNFARVEEKGDYFSSFPLREVIQPSLDLLCVKHQLAEFPLELGVASTDTVYGVQSQILESIYNILDNSFESIREKINYFLKDDERVSFKPRISLQLTQKEGFTLIEISDNGIGIRDENKRKIFAPFFTTKSTCKSGTGIGMYVVKRMIEENHGGRIWFESAFLNGTRIFIELPRSAQPADPAVSKP